MQATGSGICIDNVVKTYKRGKVRALDGVSLRVEAGEAFGIIGPNGAGKTTLFGCLLGFLRRDSGDITIDGMPPDYLAVRKVVGYLPERLDFDRWMTGYEFMCFHHQLLRRPAGQMAGEVEELLHLVELKEDAWKRPLGKYSRGMLQRLGLAQALIGKPRFLFLDEPASGVDPGGVVLFRKVLKKFHSEGLTILLNSHQLEQVERICHRVAFVRDGKIEAVEVVGDSTAGDGVLILKCSKEATGDQRDTFARVASEQAIAPLIECGNETARFVIASESHTVELVRLFVRHDLPVVEVVREEQSLERLFLAGQTPTFPESGNDAGSPTDSGSSANDSPAPTNSDDVPSRSTSEGTP